MEKREKNEERKDHSIQGVQFEYYYLLNMDNTQEVEKPPSEMKFEVTRCATCPTNGSTYNGRCDGCSKPRFNPRNTN